MLDCAFDSVVDDFANSRSGVRTLSFSGAGISVEVTVRGTSVMTLDVAVLPARPVLVEMLGGQHSGPVQLSEDGRGSIATVTPGVMSLALTWPGMARPQARTAWIRL